MQHKKCRVVNLDLKKWNCNCRPGRKERFSLFLLRVKEFNNSFRSFPFTFHASTPAFEYIIGDQASIAIRAVAPEALFADDTLALLKKSRNLPSAHKYLTNRDI